MIKAARPTSKPRSELLMVLEGDAALEELAAEALEEVEEAVEEAPEDAAAELEADAEAEGEPEDEDEAELEPGLVTLPAALIPFAASYGYGLV